MIHASRTNPARIGLCMAALAGLLLTGCGGIEGEHKISKVEVPSQNATNDVSEDKAKVVVEGKELTFEMPGTGSQTITSEEPITTGEWYTLTDNMAMTVRTKFVEGEDYDMLTETKNKAMDKTAVSHLYFE